MHDIDIYIFDLQILSSGTQVLLKNSARETKNGDKLKPRRNGPYLVHADLGKGVCRLYNPKTGKTLKNAVNVSRLTEFHTTDKSSPQQGQSATSSSSHLQSANSSTFSEGKLIVVDENARTPEKKECLVWIRDLRLYKIDEHDLSVEWHRACNYPCSPNAIDKKLSKYQWTPEPRFGKGDSVSTLPKSSCANPSHW